MTDGSQRMFDLSYNRCLHNNIIDLGRDKDTGTCFVVYEIMVLCVLSSSLDINKIAVTLYGVF